MSRLLIFIAPLILAAVGSLGLVVVCWRHRTMATARWFAFALISLACWSLAAIIMHMVSSLEAKIIWSNLQYIGITLAPLSWLLFILIYTGRMTRLALPELLLASVHPILTQVVIWTDPAHHLFRRRVWLEDLGGVAMLGQEVATCFWLHVAYSYALMLLAAYILIQWYRRRPQIYRRQGITLLAALGLPWLANIITIMLPGRLNYLDLTPFAFTLSALLLGLSLLRYESLDLFPIAREVIIESLETGIVVLNWVGRVVDMNHRAEEMLGLLRNEVVGHTLDRLLPSLADLAARCRGAERKHDEITIGEGDAAATFDLYITPLCDSNQHVTGHLISLQDITRRKRAELALSRYADQLRILYEIDQAILAADAAEKIAAAALERIYQLLPGQRLSVVTFDEVDRPQLLALRAYPPLSEAPAPWPIPMPRDGLEALLPRCVNALQPDDLSTSPAPIMALEQQLYQEGVRAYFITPLIVQGRLVGALSVENTVPHRFTSEDLEIAAQIAVSLAVGLEHVRLDEAMHQELADRKVAERALRENESSLRQKADDLAARNAELDAFAHTVAHDLKAPLALLLGYASFLEATDTPKSPEDWELSVRSIQQSAWKMSSIVDELLLLASVRKVADVPHKAIDMAPIIDNVQNRLANLIDGQSAEIVCPERWPQACGYAPWVEEVWVNYVSNAIKYGGAPPRVELGATVIEPNGEDGETPAMVRFWVRDNGEGLTEAESERVFVPFERLDRMRVQGHGLGLSIVQRIMAKLGGVAGVEPCAEGEGASFYFELPKMTS